jgi:hypothetical protein
MSHESLIGFTISTGSQNNFSCANKVSCLVSHDTNTSKVSEKNNPHEFYSKNFNHAILSKPDFVEYRNNARKEFDETQN